MLAQNLSECVKMTSLQGDSSIPGSEDSLDDVSVDTCELLRNANPRDFFGHSNSRSAMGTSPEMDFVCDSGSEPYQRNLGEPIAMDEAGHNGDKQAIMGYDGGQCNLEPQEEALLLGVFGMDLKVQEGGQNLTDARELGTWWCAWSCT